MNILERIYDVIDTILMTGELIARIFIGMLSIFGFSYLLGVYDVSIPSIVEVLIIISVIIFMARPLVSHVQDIHLEQQVMREIEVQDGKEKGEK